MDNEETLNPQNGANVKGISFADIFYILRAHLLLIIFITVLFGAGGFAYSKLRKPRYTASETVIFKTELFNDKNDNNDSLNQVSSTNYLFAYLDTAVGICRSGDVLDRANVYYQYFLTSEKSIDEFIGDLKSAYTTEIRTERGEIPGYEINDELRNKYRENPDTNLYTSDSIGTSYSSSGSGSETVTYFNLWVKVDDYSLARDMVRIYVIAADVSLNQILNFGKGTSGLIELVDKSEDIYPYPDMSPRNIIIISVVLGFVVSLVAVYLIYLSDNTVKSKEQLEKLTGANVIAYLDDVAEVK